MAVISEYKPSSLSRASLLGLLTALFIGYYAITKLVLYFQRKRFARQNGCQPVAARLPMKDPILGLDEVRRKQRMVREKRLLEYVLGQFREFGPTIGWTMVGQNVVQTIEPENTKTILSLKFKDFGLGNREKSLGRLLGRGIFTSDGEPWQHSRAMIRPNFARDQVADLDSFERHIQTLFKLLPRDGSTVDLQEYFFKFTIDSATEFLFGQSTATLKGSLNGESAASSEADFAQAFNTAQSYIASRGRIGFLRYFYRDDKGDEAIKRCHDFVDQFVDEAVRYREKIESLEKKGGYKDESYVFLHELARQTKDKKQLRDELLNVLLAGRDTTASLLSNMWFVLAHRPDIFAKLRDEVEQTLEGRLPTYKELRSMKYLRFCMNESLRIHPVVPGNSRMATRDTFLPLGGGPDGKSPLFIPKDTIVAYMTYSMHRRKDYYGPDADEFKPERWETYRPGWEYLPFNGGPRICLGQQYALTEAGYVTVRLLQEFSKIESRDPEPWSESLTLTLCSKNGTQVALTPA